MEPRIQYAKTSDGVSIAFSVLGQGPPLVLLVPFNHAGLEWGVPEVRGHHERMAQKHMLVRYDGRGCGLSDRDVDVFSLGSSLLDLQAVVDHLKLERFALYAFQYAGPVAIAYAAQHPERVSHLILWCSCARGSDMTSPQLRGLGRLLNSNWSLYAETVAHAVLGWSEGEPARAYAALLREAVSQESCRQQLLAAGQFDVTHLLGEVRCPALVLQRRHVPVPQVEVAKSLAGQITNARLVLLEGTSMAGYLGDTEAVLSAIDEFLSERETTEPSATELPQGTAIILFADIAESTALTERLGDAAFRDKARELDGSLRAVIRDHEGTPIEGKLLGDGVLAVFTSARHAIGAALRCGEAGESAGLPLHLGVHAGDVIREDDGNVYGGAVNIAARIAAESAPGEVLVSGTVRDLARTSAGVAFEDRGEQSLKGVGEPVRVFAVRTR